MVAPKPQHRYGSIDLETRASQILNKWEIANKYDLNRFK